jgi:hypothetical protein
MLLGNLRRSTWWLIFFTGQFTPHATDFSNYQIGLWVRIFRNLVTLTKLKSGCPLQIAIGLSGSFCFDGFFINSLYGFRLTKAFKLRLLRTHGRVHCSRLSNEAITDHDSSHSYPRICFRIVHVFGFHYSSYNNSNFIALSGCFSLIDICCILTLFTLKPLSRRVPPVSDDHQIDAFPVLTSVVGVWAS